MAAGAEEQIEPADRPRVRRAMSRFRQEEQRRARRRRLFWSNCVEQFVPWMAIVAVWMFGTTWRLVELMVALAVARWLGVL